MLARAKACGLRWPLPEGMSDKELEERLFPSAPGKVGYKMPDYAHVHREMQPQQRYSQVELRFFVCLLYRKQMERNNAEAFTLTSLLNSIEHYDIIQVANQ